MLSCLSCFKIFATYFFLFPNYTKRTWRTTWKIKKKVGGRKHPGAIDNVSDKVERVQSTTVAQTGHYPIAQWEQCIMWKLCAHLSLPLKTMCLWPVNELHRRWNSLSFFNFSWRTLSTIVDLHVRKPDREICPVMKIDPRVPNVATSLTRSLDRKLLLLVFFWYGIFLYPFYLVSSRPAAYDGYYPYLAETGKDLKLS